MSLLNLPIFCHDTVFSLGAIQLKWEFLQLGPNGTESTIRLWVSGRLEGRAATVSGWSEPGSLRAFVCFPGWIPVQFGCCVLLCYVCWLPSFGRFCYNGLGWVDVKNAGLILVNWFLLLKLTCQRSFKNKNIICAPFLYIQGTLLRIWVPTWVCLYFLWFTDRFLSPPLSALSCFYFPRPSCLWRRSPGGLCVSLQCVFLWQPLTSKRLAALWEGLVSMQVRCAVLGGWLPGAHLTASFQHSNVSLHGLGDHGIFPNIAVFFQTSFNNLVLFPYSVQRKWLLLFFFLHNLHFKTKHLSPSQHCLTSLTVFGWIFSSTKNVKSLYFWYDHLLRVC